MLQVETDVRRNEVNIIVREDTLTNLDAVPIEIQMQRAHPDVSRIPARYGDRGSFVNGDTRRFSGHTGKRVDERL